MYYWGSADYSRMWQHYASGKLQKKIKMAAPDVRAEFVCTAPTIQTTENYSSTGKMPVDYLAGGT